MAGGDEVDDGTDNCFARLDGWWVVVGRVESVEEGSIPSWMLDARHEAVR